MEHQELENPDRLDLEAEIADLEFKLTRARADLSALSAPALKSSLPEGDSPSCRRVAFPLLLPGLPLSDPTFLLEAIVENSPAGIAVVGGSQLNIYRANPAFRMITPDPGLDPQGCTWNEVWLKGQTFQVDALLRYVLKTGDPVRSDHHRRVFPNGDVHSYSLGMTPLTLDGEPAVLVMLWETTSFQKAQTRVEESARRQDILLKQNLEQLFFLEHLLDSINDGFFAVDSEWRLTYLNSQAGSVFRFPADELLGKTLWEAWPEAAGSAFEPVFRLVMHLRQDAQLREIAPGKAETWLDVGVHPFLDGISVFFSDVSARVRSEKDLRRSEQRFRQLADAMPALVWTARPDGAVDYYNQRYQEFKGIAPTTGDAWEWSPVLHPEDRELTHARWSQSLQTGSIYQVEHRVQMADSSYRWFLSRGIPVQDDQGSILKWYGTATDIHDQKLVEQELSDRENRLQRMLEAAQVGIVFARSNGSVAFVNDAARRMMHLQPSSSTELDWRVFLANTWDENNQSILDAALHLGRLGPVEVQARRPDGSLVWLLISLVNLRQSEDEFIVFMVDISNQKNAEAALQEYAFKLEQSNKELEQFAFIASHDMSEPLRKIEVFSSAVTRSASEKLDPTELDYLARLNRAAGRMRRMINDLLELSRITTRAQPFQKICLGEAVRGALSDLELRILQTSGQVEVGELPEIEADPFQMRRLFQNLISNALKFHRPDAPPVVKVSAIQLPDGEVQLAVEDNGIGFPTSHAETLFQPFRRLVGRAEFEGSGIGLAICRKIVDRHGGRFLVDSVQGQGSTFKVILPTTQLHRLG
jgi:PAS domain S-box-containing protein